MSADRHAVSRRNPRLSPFEVTITEQPPVVSPPSGPSPPSDEAYFSIEPPSPPSHAPSTDSSTFSDSAPVEKTRDQEDEDRSGGGGGGTLRGASLWGSVFGTGPLTEEVGVDVADPDVISVEVHVESAGDDEEDEKKKEKSKRKCDCRCSPQQRWNTAEIFALVYAVGAELLVLRTCSPFIADLMVDFGVVNDITKSGFYTGIANLITCVCLAISCIFWTRISNCVGRKPILLVSGIFNIVLMILLGFSNNFVYFCVIRALIGLFTGAGAVAKTSLAEMILPPKWKTFAFSCVNTSCCMTYILGNVIGGLLGRPVQQYSGWTFGRDFFDRFPLFLVFLAVAIVHLIGLALVFFFVEYRAQPCSRPIVVENLEPVLTIATDDPEASSEKEPVGCGAKICSALKSEAFSRIPLTTVFLYCVIGVSSTLVGKTVPVLFALPREKGGLGMANWEIGVVGWTYGCLAVICSALGPLILSGIYAIHALRIASLVVIPALVVYPELHYLLALGQGGRVAIWISVVFMLFIRALMGQLAWTCILMAIPNSVDSSSHSVLQALSGFLGGIGKGLGPYIGNTMLAVGASVGVFPLDLHFSLILSALGFIVIFLVSSCCLPVSLSLPKGEFEKLQIKEKEEREEQANHFDSDFAARFQRAREAARRIAARDDPLQAEPSPSAAASNWGALASMRPASPAAGTSSPEPDLVSGSSSTRRAAEHWRFMRENTWQLRAQRFWFELRHGISTNLRVRKHEMWRSRTSTPVFSGGM